MKIAILLTFFVLAVVSSAQKDINFEEQKQLQSINNGRLFQPIFNLFEMLYGLVSILKNCLIFISKYFYILGFSHGWISTLWMTSQIVAGSTQSCKQMQEEDLMKI